MATDTKDKGQITFRVDKSLKEDAQKLYADLGMDMTTAITLFLKQSLREQALPFQVSRFNADTMAALLEAQDSEKLKTYKSVDDWWKQNNADA
jgi:DNA-damage-inducible protein J